MFKQKYRYIKHSPILMYILKQIFLITVKWSFSLKQWINTRSSTEAELMGVNNAMALVLWMCHFLEDQRFTVKDNVVYQDNKSTILLEKNGCVSSPKHTHHIEIHYFFVMDNSACSQMMVQHCPTDVMLADFLTKPLHGSAFHTFCVCLLNLPDADNTMILVTLGLSFKNLLLQHYLSVRSCILVIDVS